MQLEMLASWVVLGLIVLGAIVLGIFLLFREFWTWYWKQSEQVELLRHIAKHIQLLEERDRAFSPPGHASWPPAESAASPRG